MPESTSEQPPIVESPTRSEQESRLDRFRHDLSLLFDEYRETGLSPKEKLVRDMTDLEEMRFIYGPEMIATFEAGLETVPLDSKEEFIEQVTNLVLPFIELDGRDDIKERAQEYNRHAGFESVDIGALASTAHPMKVEATLSDGVLLNKKDRVLELSWPDDASAPRGLHDVLDSLKKAADYLRAHPDIKAVVLTSWMMNHPITTKLGFRSAKDVPYLDQAHGSLRRGKEARAQKPYGWKLDLSDVKFGYMTREEFLSKY